jgi:hypothetical protein
MKIKFFSLFIAYFLIACNSNKEKKISNNKTNSIEKSEANLEPKKKLKPFETSFGRYSFKMKNDTTLSILVNGNENQKLTTSIAVELNDFKLSDWNFDGYEDIFITTSQGNVARSYQIWTYYPKNGLFEVNELLTDKLGLEKDDAKKIIVFHYREGVENEYWEKYKYKADSLIFINELIVNQWTDKKQNHWMKKTLMKKEKNNLIVSVDSFIVEKNY